MGIECQAQLEFFTRKYQRILGHLSQIASRAVLGRSLLDMLASFLFITALMNMPIANMAAIMQSVPLVVVVFATVFLSEKGGAKRIAAVVVGFLGVMLVVKPAPQTVSIYEFVALATVHGGTLDDVHARPVVALHVHVACHELLGSAVVQIPRDRQRLEKHPGMITALPRFRTTPPPCSG